MTIYFAQDKNKTITIKATGEVRYSEHWKKFYVPGHRWIKSTQKFSGNALVHCVDSYQEVPANLAKCYK